MLGRSLMLAGLLGATSLSIASAAPLAPLAGIDADSGLVAQARTGRPRVRGADKPAKPGPRLRFIAQEPRRPLDPPQEG